VVLFAVNAATIKRWRIDRAADLTEKPLNKPDENSHGQNRLGWPWACIRMVSGIGRM
jgi:hypothetical protein